MPSAISDARRPAFEGSLWPAKSEVSSQPVLGPYNGKGKASLSCAWGTG